MPTQGGIRLLFLLYLIVKVMPVSGQEPQPGSSLIKVSTIKDYQRITNRTGVYIDRNRRADFQPHSNDFDWKSKHYLDNYVPLENTIFSHYYRFFVYNDQPDTAVLYYYVSENEAIRLWQNINDSDAIREIPAEYYQPNPLSQVVLFRLTMPPYQGQTYTARLQPFKQPFFLVRPYLMTASFQRLFFHDNTEGFSADNIVLLIFCGMLAMMLLYMAAKSLQIRSAEYFYYAGYIAFFLGYFTLKIILFSRVTFYQQPFFYSYLNNILQVLAYCMYFQFFRKFLTTSLSLPRLDKVLVISTVVLLAYALLDLLALLFLPEQYLWRLLVWNGVRLSLLILTVYSIVQMIRVKSRLVHYMLAGTISFTLLSLMAMVFSAIADQIIDWVTPFNIPLFYFEAGVAVELICFSLGLGYKNREDEMQKLEAQNTLQLERERQTFEQYKVATEAREAERKRIGGEMHDDIGSGLTSILFLTNTLKMQSLTSQSTENSLSATTDKISTMATNLVDNMNDIIWSMNAKHDTLESLVTYIRSQTSALLENAGLDYHFQVAEPIPSINLSGEQRRNIYLAVREAVHNLIKHANATQATITITFDRNIHINIQDNGKGIDVPTIRRWGNGLKNMQQRLADVQGTLEISKEVGTLIRLEAPLPDQPGE